MIDEHRFCRLDLHLRNSKLLKYIRDNLEYDDM